uniref:Pre-rRNA-processing protein TSR1 homolog n=1 Tax=Rhizophora mucronata TaxID=61149 RepID=A0A2P2M9E2_RHIMU
MIRRRYVLRALLVNFLKIASFIQLIQKMSCIRCWAICYVICMVLSILGLIISAITI